MVDNRLVLVSRPSAERLTPSERDVVELAHLRNRDIAELRGSSLATVKAQMRSALMKLGAETRTAAALALQARRAA